ncbi:hypothetical protein [Grimontia hollisae]|uniref:hypothetical protein n=1 Tax=Grimontia hollisae TaxID=673 RepID=UPI00165E5A35|nr:hypothetical protein [Grimontia hollisae]
MTITKLDFGSIEMHAVSGKDNGLELIFTGNVDNYSKGNCWVVVKVNQAGDKPTLEVVESDNPPAFLLE